MDKTAKMRAAAWLFCVVVFLAIYSWINDPGSRLKRYLLRGEVRSVVIQANRVVQAQLKNDEAIEMDARLTEDLAQAFSNAQVAVTHRKTPTEPPWYLALLAEGVPILIFIIIGAYALGSVSCRRNEHQRPNA